MDLDLLDVKDGFRLRGESVSRLETFVDAAFAFAVSMLVISVGALPKDVTELFLALHKVPTFAACFLLIATFWAGHDRWSRRFGIEDTRTKNLSLVFVFVMLVYVYPLRMVLSGGLAFISRGWVPSEMQLDNVADLETCFVIYGVGFTSLSLLMWRLNQYALKHGAAIGLDALEELKTRQEMGSYALLAAFGLASIALALCLRGAADARGFVPGAPGFLYSGLGIAMPIFHGRMGRKERELLASGAVVRRGRAVTAAELSPG
jgi:uncharacterized membrane protein